MERADVHKYTCQLSHIMCESHACGSKIVTSSIQTNFSCLTDNSERNYLKTNKIEIQLFFVTFEKSSDHFRDSLIMLEIGWKSFGNHCRLGFKVVKNLSTPYLQKLLETFSNLRKSSEIFDNLWKPSVNLRKFRFCGDEKSHAFY